MKKREDGLVEAGVRQQPTSPALASGGITRLRRVQMKTKKQFVVSPYETGEYPFSNLDEHANFVIQLLDWVSADDKKVVAVPYREKASGAATKTGDRWAAIERSIQDNHLNRPRFEKWLGVFLPDVGGDGFEDFMDNPDECILKGAESCLRVLKKLTDAASTDGGAQDGQGGAIPENKG
jgi:hypothetical protein